MEAFITEGRSLSNLTLCLLPLIIYLKGLPVIQSAQKAQSTKTGHYQIIMTIATFLAGVTATVLQMSPTKDVNGWITATNILFLSSIVFSVASTMGAMVAGIWKSSDV